MQRNEGVVDEVKAVFDRCDEDGDQRIGFDEFKGLMLEIGDPRSAGGLRLCFDAIDLDHDGKLSLQELRAWWPLRHPANA